MSKRNWSDILQAQRDSGLSIEAFCRVKNGRAPIFIRRALGRKNQGRRMRSMVDLLAFTPSITERAVVH